LLVTTLLPSSMAKPPPFPGSIARYMVAAILILPFYAVG
jgi:hypothetical protein